MGGIVRLIASVLMAAGCSVSASDQVLRCTVEGEWNGGVRILDLTIVPPRGGAELDLWALEEDHEPGVFLKRRIGVGSIQTGIGSSNEREDLVFLRVGNEKGVGHIAVWGLGDHPAFVVVKTWESPKQIYVMDGIGPERVLSGTCD